MTRSTAGTSWSGRGSWCAPISGAAGIDQQTIADVEQYGVDRLLDELAADLKEGSWRPLPARRVFIPKPGARGAEAALDSCCPRPDRAGGREDGD